MKLKTLCVLVLALATQILKAQDKLFEFNTGLNGGIIDQPTSETSALPYLNLSLQLLYKINPHLSAGIAYNGTILDTKGVISLNNQFFEVSPKTQSFGVIIKAGTNRYKRFCVYGFAALYNTHRADIVSSIDQPTTTEMNTSGLSYCLGVGAMIKISRSISLKLFEAGIVHYSSSLNYFEDKALGGSSVDSGFVFMLFRKK